MRTDTFALAEFLQQQQILDAPTWPELHRLAGACAEPAALIEELEQRGWLTAFQVERLLDDPDSLVLGEYVLLDWVGRGGMGEVYKGRQLRLGRTVALKTIRRDRCLPPEDVQRFQREARASAQLQHPNIVTVYDVNEANGIHFIAMELVEGIDLARCVRQNGQLPVGMACEYVRQAALGLQHAHEHGLVHRDIKPSNLMVTRSSPTLGPVVKILDFGLARFVREANEDASLTPTGQWLGTPDFIAPEQACDSKHADIRADIFSLGCVLYYLLTGHPAFPGNSSAEKLAARLSQEPQTLAAWQPEAPAGLAQVLRQMLARHPDERFQQPREVALALAPFACRELGDTPAPHDTRAVTRGAAEPATPRLPGDSGAGSGSEPSTKAFTPTAPEQPLPRQPVWLVAGLVLGLLALALTIAWWPWQWPDFTPPRGGPVVSTNPEPKASAPEAVAGEPRWLVNSLNMKLARIPAGEFLMGSPPEEEGRADDEGPQWQVAFTRTFYLGVYEVTQEEFARVMGNNPSHFSALGAGRDQVVDRPTLRFPVENVSWEMASTFCRLLSQRPEERAAGRSYRLPAEAEWEYACRAGTKGPFHFGAALSSLEANMDGRRPYGGAVPDVARPHTVEVGQFPPNAFGLHDMHGNVWEWCHDRYQSYDDRLKGVLPRAERDENRVLRGGAWLFSGADCRSARRSFRSASTAGQYYGFRVVCDVLGKGP